MTAAVREQRVLEAMRAKNIKVPPHVNITETPNFFAIMAKTLLKEEPDYEQLLFQSAA